jgi:hypothetical protein
MGAKQLIKSWFGLLGRNWRHKLKRRILLCTFQLFKLKYLVQSLKIRPRGEENPKDDNHPQEDK